MTTARRPSRTDDSMQVDRRELLAGAAMLIGGALGGRAAWAKSVDEVGIQLYTLRGPMSEDFEGTVERVAEIGYSKVEFAGYGGLTPAQISQLLKDTGLSAPATHVQIAALEEPQELIDDCLAMGHDFLVMAYLLPNQRKTFDQYQRHAEVLNRAGELCNASGLKLGYHNHDFEFIELEGRLPMDYLLTQIAPETMVMELDLYWAAKVGVDPLTYFERWPGRFPMLHVKDMDSTGGFTEVGSGVIDFARIFAQAETAGIEHHFVEQDVIQGDPFDSVAKSFRQLRAIEF